MGVGYPAGWIIWEASNRKYFIAKPSEKDDRPDEISVQIIDSTPVSDTNGAIEVRHVPKIVTNRTSDADKLPTVKV
jgi:hypothetical protein